MIPTLIGDPAMASLERFRKAAGRAAKAAARGAGAYIPEKLRNTAYLRTFALLRIPMMFYVAPTVLESSLERCQVVIKLNRRTKNHLGSMYFGVLAIGADCAGGLIAMRAIEEGGHDVSLVFKDFKADFLKRPESDVVFTCKDGRLIQDMIRETLETGERVSRPIRVTGTCPDKFGDEPVAEFILTLSLKKKS